MHSEDADERDYALPPNILRSFFGVITGFLGALIGTAGGATTITLYVFFGYPIKKSIGLSTVTGLAIGVSSLFFSYYNGYKMPGLPSFSFGES